MASVRVFIAAFLLVSATNICLAREFIVGDESGWTIGCDYKAWATDKVFHVGDKLGNTINLPKPRLISLAM